MVMTGFSGESDEHFQAPCDLIEKVRFDHLGVFWYCPETVTPAATWGSKVSRWEARRRVLVEGVRLESDYLLTGRLASQTPEIDGQV
jgi:tRNA A37 methylthiotransferase MiaB